MEKKKGSGEQALACGSTTSQSKKLLANSSKMTTCLHWCSELL